MKKIIILILVLSPMLLLSQYGKAELRRDTRVRESPSDKSLLAETITGGANVEVLDFENTYWLVEYGNVSGWVSSNDLWKTSVMNNKLRGVREKEERAKYFDKMGRIVELYGEQYADRIMNHRIWIGMTKAMLIESRGYPDDRNTTRTAGNFSEQWIYGKDISSRKYVYLDNGVVTAIQNY